jgi:hypothetical protein
MSISSDLQGTEQDLNIWVHSDELISGTITGADGNAIDGLDVTAACFVKADLEDEDADAIAEATVAIAADGTFTLDFDRDALDPLEVYYYQLKLRFGDDYSTVRLRGTQLCAMYGKLTTSRDATRAV